MPRSKTYRSDVSASVHKTMSGLHRLGLIDKATMREFDTLCLTMVEKLSPEEILALREREGVSQAVFAAYLNVTPILISKWERGEKKPSGPSLKLLITACLNRSPLRSANQASRRMCLYPYKHDAQASVSENSLACASCL